MNLFNQPRRSFLIALITLFSMGCGGLSALLPAGTDSANQPPTPTIDPNFTPSPLAGKWNAESNLGQLAFTIDPSGSEVTSVDLNMVNWKCGGTLLTTRLSVQSTWSVSDGQFSVDFYLGDEQHLPLVLDGTYDPKHHSFSGTWNVDAYGTTCTGNWKAAASK